MGILLRVASAKIRRGIKKSAFQSAAVFVSMLVISFFCCFIVSISAFTAENPSFGLDGVLSEDGETLRSLSKFFESVISGMSVIAVAVVLLSAISLLIYSRLRTDENKRFFATLTSIGATGAQRRIISVTETLVLYGLPIILGSFLGMLPSRMFAERIIKIFVSGYSPSAVSWLLPIAISALGIVTVIIFTRAPRIGRRRSVMEQLKSHNKSEEGESHNYRQSYTFRSMPIEQRIAKKSVDYYKSAYRRITFMFISCVMYPVLAIFFFVLVAKPKVTDYTPNQGIDVVALISIFSKNIAIFGAVLFILLSVFGILQTVYIIKAQNRVRRESLTVYRSVGMTDTSIKQVLRYEYRAVALYTFVYLVFILAFMIILVASV